MGDVARLAGANRRLIGDPVDFEALHHTLRPPVIAYLRRFVGEAEAEDLAQEVFLKVHCGLPKFRQESKVSTWVFQIATHAALDHLKGASNRAVQHQVPLEHAEESCIEEGHGRAPLQAEMACCIREMVATLSAEDQAILHLCELKELKVGDIAAILEITPGAAKIRLHRARQRLKSRMESKCQISLDHRGELDCDRK